MIADHLDTKGVGIDVDNLGEATLPSTGAPLTLYGTGRPDTPALTAPTGSAYIFAGTQEELAAAPVNGARVWKKTPDAWVCTEGETPWRNCSAEPPTGVSYATGLSGVYVQRRAGEIVFNIQNASVYATAIVAQAGSEAHRWFGGWGNAAAVYNGSTDSVGISAYDGKNWVLYNSESMTGYVIRGTFALYEPDLPWPSSSYTDMGDPYIVIAKLEAGE